MNLSHQLHAIRQAVKMDGQNCVFSRQGENEFHEPLGEIKILECKGLYHTSNELNYLSASVMESGKIYTEKRPKLLILFEDSVQLEDKVSISGAEHRVTGIDDLGNLHLCLELSLEVI